MKDVPCLEEISRRLRAEGIGTPLVADIHFSPEIAMAVVPVVEKIRINPGNFHPDHEKARELFG
jgi:(E)-4-hydroxy-3-methylbut-2-enyl-diphosphate synthase